MEVPQTMELSILKESEFGSFRVPSDIVHKLNGNVLVSSRQNSVWVSGLIAVRLQARAPNVRALAQVGQVVQVGALEI